jgi:RNA polymerase sigma-70 factor (ECF subfamily)
MTDQDPEQTIRAAFAAGEIEAAATLALQCYSDEISNFLVSRLGSRSDAAEVFSMFAEDLWTGLPNFAWRCSMRTWAYSIARNAAARYLASPHQKPQRRLSFSHLSNVSELVARARSATLVFQQTETRSRFRALREQLAPEDQMLLVLRVDRGLSWRDLAIAMTGDAELGDEAIQRESSRLRKAFERLKGELRRAAEREGLLKSRD